MYLKADSTRATLLGFLFRHSDASWAELLPFSPALSVLYGFNGAGKSWTLEDIRKFWRGMSCESRSHPCPQQATLAGGRATAGEDDSTKRLAERLASLSRCFQTVGLSR